MTYRLLFIISVFIYKLEDLCLVDLSSEEGGKLLESIFHQLHLKDGRKWDRILNEAWEYAGFERGPSKKIIDIAEHFGMEEYV